MWMPSRMYMMIWYDPLNSSISKSGFYRYMHMTGIKTKTKFKANQVKLIDA